MRVNRLWATGAVVLLAGFGGVGAVQADTAQEVAERCGGCHRLQAPAEPTLAMRTGRKAPALFFAGNKFREGWLVRWLQNPKRIRPVSDFPPAHVTTTTEGDVVDPTTLIDHPALDAPTAERFAAHLLTLTPYDALLDKESYTPGRVSARMGEMDFVKFKGCGGCHRDTPEYGGLSGPELYTAWQRLQPEFIVSYIRNPVAWEPYSLMPVKHLRTPQIHKLADYLRVIGEEDREK